MLETGLSDVAGNDENAVQKVITLRDVSLIHAVILAQEAELAAHKNALAGMKKVADSVSLTTHTSPVSQASPLPNGSSELSYLTAWVLAMLAVISKGNVWRGSKTSKVVFTGSAPRWCPCTTSIWFMRATC
jgi:hypothetical protein